MSAAMEEAIIAAERDEVPIGAVVVHRATGKVITKGSNKTRELNDPTAHAEILALREACRIMGAQRIPECDLYVTLEPCTMCAAAISFARIHTIHIAATDPKGGGVLHGAKFYEQPTCHHRPVIKQGALQNECGQILKNFFRSKR